MLTKTMAVTGTSEMIASSRLAGKVSIRNNNKQKIKSCYLKLVKYAITIFLLFSTSPLKNGNQGFKEMHEILEVDKDWLMFQNFFF